jgi:hypothetical protein
MKTQAQPQQAPPQTMVAQQQNTASSVSNDSLKVLWVNRAFEFASPK